MKFLSKGLRKVRKATSKIAGAEGGFTVVELTMVIVISVIMLAGMVAMITNSFDIFNTSKDVQAISDSQRRLTASITRQLRSALFLVNGECTSTVLAFYSDLDNDQGATADVDAYANAEKVTISLVGNKVMMSVLEPDGTPEVPATIGSYVDTIEFYYFMAGEKPELNSGNPDPLDPINSYAGVEINEEVGMIRIVLRMHKGGVRRNFYQDVFLRVIDRT